jgi:serine/threonine kinase 32
VFEQLIERNVNNRLGCRPDGKGIEDIHQHSWYASIDWSTLDTKEAQPPFVPNVRCSFHMETCLNLTTATSDQMNQANFDVSHELDEFLMVEKPLTHNKRKANADLDKLKPELRHMEEQ